MDITKVQKSIDTEIEKSLSLVDINNFFWKLFNKNVRVIDVNRIAGGEYTLNDLFTKDIKNFKCSINNRAGEYIEDLLILFIPTIDLYIGHWTTCFKRGNKFYYFDSYADNYNVIIEKVNRSNNDIFINNNFAYLVLNSGFEIDINKYKYQTNMDTDNCCGYHSSICAFFFLTNSDFSFTKYKDWIDEYKRTNHHTKYDIAVLYLFKNLSRKT